MIQSVNKIFVGNPDKAITSIVDSDGNRGDIVIYNVTQKKVAIAPADVNKGDKIKIGIVTGTVATDKGVNIPAISWGNVIDPIKVKSFDYNTTAASNGFNAYVAPTEQSYKVDLTNVVLAADNRYVLRVLYKDIFELKSQYTKSYEVYGAANETAATLAAKFVAVINADQKDARITAVYTTGNAYFNVVAKVKDDNEGVNSLNEYSQVLFNVSLYYNTLDDGFVYNLYYKDAGAEITQLTAPTPGKGNWKVIRDKERRAQGYKGVLNRTQFPVLVPDLFVTAGKSYLSITLEYENLYLSNDNQYLKNTPLAEEIYVPSDTSVATADLRNFVNVIAKAIGADQVPASA